MSDETIHWLRGTASANNISTSSIDYAKIDEARRREYEKIEQVNRMHMAARALGFPDKISSEVKYKSSYYVIISIHDCFDPEYYKWSRSTAVVVNSHCFFIDLGLNHLMLFLSMSRFLPKELQKVQLNYHQKFHHLYFGY